MGHRLNTVVCAAFAVLALSGCASPYQKFYRPNPSVANSTIPIVPFSGEPVIGPGSNDPRQDIRSMYEQGYGLVGSSNFVGPAQAASGALAQAKKIGAARVLLYRRYRNTETGAMPLTLPTATTSYSSGTVNAFGTGGYAMGNYSGTTTTYGTETTFIPYSVDKYNQLALYFAPLERTGLGIVTHRLTDSERQTLGSNIGLEIAVVRTGSPAFKADVLPGDLLLSFGVGSVYDAASLRQAIAGARGHETQIVLFRGGRKITKTLTVPDGDW